GRRGPVRLAEAARDARRGVRARSRLPRAGQAGPERGRGGIGMNPKVWPWISRVVGLALLGVAAAAYVAWQRPGDLLAARVLNYVRCRQKVVALTFDDGPHPVITALLLDTLKRYRAHATFYVVGTKAAESPELVRRMRADGHEVENHTYSHDNL